MVKKSLQEMTNEELWQLFPIILTEHKSYWKEYYEEERAFLEGVIGKGNILRINHIGSTAIPDIIAKPTIDILIEIRADLDIDSLINNMEAAGYIYSYQPEKPAPHMMFMKGYSPNGFEEKVFHIHVRYEGDWDEIYFRDYLISHPETAGEYGELKLMLKNQYEHDRDGYTLAKSDFINRIVMLARNSG